MTVDKNIAPSEWLRLVLDLEKRVAEFVWAPFNWPEEDYAILELELWERVQESTELLTIGLKLSHPAWSRICAYSTCRTYVAPNPDDPSPIRNSTPCLDADTARRKGLLPPLRGEAR